MCGCGKKRKLYVIHACKCLLDCETNKAHVNINSYLNSNLYPSATIMSSKENLKTKLVDRTRKDLLLEIYSPEKIERRVDVRYAFKHFDRAGGFHISKRPKLPDRAQTTLRLHPSRPRLETRGSKSNAALKVPAIIIKANQNAEPTINTERKKVNKMCERASEQHKVIGAMKALRAIAYQLKPKFAYIDARR
eukprot:TRINITY_DN13920_c0_g1_i2.p1 TRINITY_DN13920_c0_g1~~TRINITY_DN13920_c0_g1_i2.p1  ORF type:complete len:192 (-),score=7.47 TRINITY_DN13920_c0_g1_i2:234-809(-)